MQKYDNGGNRMNNRKREDAIRLFSRLLITFLTVLAFWSFVPGTVRAEEGEMTTKTVNGRRTTTIEKSITLEKNTVLYGDVVINASVHLNGHLFSVQGNVLMLSEVHVEKGRFYVKGNLHQADPALYVGGGSVEVQGNYSIEGTERDKDGNMKPSNGWIKMENEKDQMIIGGNFSSRSNNTSVLSAGIMEFKGNVTDYTGNTFRCSGTHKVSFTSPRRQVVEFANSSACFQTVKSSYNVQFKTLGIKQLTESVTILGPVEKIWNKLDLNGKTMTINGNVDALMSDIDLNGGNLYVTGNFHQLDPAIYFNGGSLRVSGNYTLCSDERNPDNSYKPSNGWLKMENEKDRLYVTGNFSTRSNNTSVLSAGRMQFWGNVTDYTGNTLKASGTHLALFTASKKRNVVDLQNGSRFQSINVTYGQVQFKQLGVNTLTSNVAIYGNVDDIRNKLDLNGHTMTIYGSVNKVSSEIDLNGGKLIVTGDFHQVDPCVNFNGGTLEVQGNYNIESPDKEADNKTPKPSNGWLKMENKSDKLIVGGAFSARSNNTSVLSNGIMEFRGNVTDYTGNTIRCSGEHKAVFSGSKNQIVDLKHSSACFESIRTVNQNVTFRQMGIHRLTENVVLTGDTEEIWNKLDLCGYSMLIQGNVNNVSSDITLNRGTLTVTGNLLQTNPAVYFSKGTLEVKGNYRIESLEKETDGVTPKPSNGWLKMEDKSDRLIVGRSFYARSNNTSVLSNGTMVFKGNVTDYSGNTFRCSGENKAVFSGSWTQTVDLKKSSACFESISTINSNVTFKQLGIHRLTENIVLRGDIEDIWNKIDLNGHVITVNGSVKKASSDIDLNSGRFIVTKDFHLENPAIYFNKGLLQTGGNFTIESSEKGTDGIPKASNGWLKMADDQDRLVVVGNFSARSNNTSVLSAGLMEFKRDVNDYTGNTFRCSGTNKASFTGPGFQVVEFANSSACFQTIRTLNKNVRFKTLGVRQLTESVTISGPVEKIWNKLDLNGKKMTINGSVNALMADLDLNKGTLRVNGSFYHRDPAIYFNKGTLIITGSYTLRSNETEASSGSYKPSNGWLKMENPEDCMIVSHQFTAKSNNTSVMRDGVLSVGGALIDITGNTVRTTGNPGETSLTVGGEIVIKGVDVPKKRKSARAATPTPVPTSAPAKTPSPTAAPAVPTVAPVHSPAPTVKPTATPTAAPSVKTAQYKVIEKNKVFYLYKTEDGNWNHAVKVPVNNWRIVEQHEVDKAVITVTGDGGCRLTVNYTLSSNPFSQGSGVSVACTYEGKEYTGSWSDERPVILDEGPTVTPKPVITISPDDQALIEQLKQTKPTTLPAKIIKFGYIDFKGYKEPGITITGYEFAVREGKDGEWVKVKSVSDEIKRSNLFPRLEQGETYWYKYRYFLTVNGKDYYSQWSNEMGDVYTFYDN